jgi:uncharacterized damage-inducible protein DinB
MNHPEREQLLTRWEREHQRTMVILEALPKGQYDLRPEAENRSLGEMAWHLAEGEACVTHAIVVGKFDPQSASLEELKQPTTIAELAPSFERVHRLAVARVAGLTEEQLASSIVFMQGTVAPVQEILWTNVIGHTIHHRGQLMLLVRQAGGTVPGIYGPNREAFPLTRAAAAS